jgi:dTDP-4-dehydrorhamnose reductase
MRILLTGSSGRLGGAFLSLWGKRGDVRVIAPGRGELDLAAPERLRSYLQAAEFDVLVNPAAITNLEECPHHPELARLVNSVSPQVMAGVCREKGARLVHFSTDYVFSGEQPGLKTEQNPTGPVNIYGKTKEESERAVLETDETALVCRVSWLFGPTPAGRPYHLDNVLSRAKAGEVQHLIADKFAMPTFTGDVVHWVELLLRAQARGIYHLCNSGEPESWYSSARKVCELAGYTDYAADAQKLVATSIDDAHFFSEKRPVHTAMSPARFVSEGIARPRHWLEAAADYLKSR